MGGRIEPTGVIGEVLRIYRDQAAVLLPVALVLFALDALIGYALRDSAAAIIAAAVSIVVSTFYQGMVVQLVRDVQDGRRDNSVADLLRSVSPVVAQLIAVAVISGIGIAIGFVLLVVPGLYLLTIWSVVAPVTIVERPGVPAAFGRSRALVQGHGWQVFGAIVLVFLLLLAVGVVSAILVGGMGDAGAAVVGWALNVLTAPVAALVASVLYFALREAHGEPPRPEDAIRWAPPAPPASSY